MTKEFKMLWASLLGSLDGLEFEADEVIERSTVVEMLKEHIELYKKAEKSLSEQKEKHEQELKKLYEWMVGDNKELAQTYFTSGMIRNIAKEIEFKHDKEMEEFAEWINDSAYVFNKGVWQYTYANKQPDLTTTELLTKFKNR